MDNENKPIQILEASAGAGKTYALTKRYIELLLQEFEDDPHTPFRSILAITFTNKASIEMKERVLLYLKKLALKDFSSKAEEKALLTFLGPKKVTPKILQNILDAIIDNYSFFQIRTIDSFVNSLLTSCGIYLGFSSDVTIEDNISEYIAFCLDELMDAVSRDNDTKALFENFLKQYLLIENKDNWMPKRDILSSMHTLFNVQSMYAKHLQSSGTSVEKMISSSQILYYLFENLRDNLPKDTHKRFVSSLQEYLSKNKNSIDVETLSAFFKRKEIPVKKGAVISPQQDKLWKNIRKTLTEHVLLLCESRFDSYINIYKQLYKGLQQLQRKENIIFLSELNEKTKQLLHDHDITMAEIFYRISSRIKHFLLDEFQDTSVLQWDNMKELVDEALSQGGTCFYVGDKKQSIYRFRGAQMELFDSVEKELSRYGIQKEYLLSNYRSAQTIVDFNNKIFSKENISRFLDVVFADIQQQDALPSYCVENIASVFENTQQKTEDQKVKGYLEIQTVKGESKKELNESIKEKTIVIIKDIMGRYDLKDVAVLCRTHAEVGEVTQWFIEQGVAVSSDKTLNIKEHFIIKEIISFLQFLYDPSDNVAFTGFFSGKILAEKTGVEPSAIESFITKHRMELLHGKKVFLYEKFRTDFGEVWKEQIEFFWKKSEKIPLYEFVTSMINRFDILEHFKGSHGYIMKFLEFIRVKEDKYNNIESFLRCFESAPARELFVDIDSSEAVSVMNVHQSKGLEFEIVIMPFAKMEKSFSISAKGGNSSNGAIRKGGGFLVLNEDDHVKLKQLNKKYTEYSDQIRDLFVEERAKSIQDDLNMLYVAFTRAKKELYIITPEDEKKSVLKELFNAYQYVQGSKSAGSVQRPAARTEKKIQAVLKSDWLEIIKEQFKTKEEFVNRKAIIKGEYFHYILSLIEQVTDESIDALIDEACQRARAKYMYTEQQGVKKSIKNFILSEGIREFFFTKDTILNEQEICSDDGEFIRIDRMTSTEKDINIIDYKSSYIESSLDTYKEQVKKYKKAVKSIYPDKNITGYIVFIDTKKSCKV